MGRAYGPRDWAMVVAFGVIGMLYVTFKPEGKQAHKDVIIEQFGLPEDVTFDSFRSGFGRHSPSGVAAQTSGTSADLTRVHGTSTSDVWAVGEAGTVLHWDGSDWSEPTATGLSGDADFDDVLALSSTEVWVVGYEDFDDGAAWKWNGSSWTEHGGWPGQAYLVVEVDGEVLVGGGGGQLLRVD